MSTTRHLINRQRRLAAVSAAAEERAGERTVRPAPPAAGQPVGFGMSDDKREVRFELETKPPKR